MLRSITISSLVLASTLAAGSALAQAPAANNAPQYCGGFGGSGTPVIKPIIYPSLHFDRSDPGFDCQMWQAFIYLNWPAQAGQRGVPNANAKFGAPGTTVWETYKTVDQVYLPNGQNPGPWNQAAAVAAVPNNLRAQVASGALSSVTVPANAPLPLGNPNTDTLMNAALETFLQSKGTSCLGCHAYATVAPQGAQNATSYSFTFSYAQAP